MDEQRVDVRGNGAAMGLGIAGLVLGILGIAIAWIPFIGMFALPFVGLGMILSFVGILVAAVGQRGGYGFPVGAGLVSLIAIGVVVVVNVLAVKTIETAAGATKDALEETEKANRAREIAAFHEAIEKMELEKEQAALRRSQLSHVTLNNVRVAKNALGRYSLYGDLRNGAPVAFYGVRFEVVAVTAGRSTPWAKGEMITFISGGLEPGETTAIEVIDSDYVLSRIPADRADVTYTVTIKYVSDIDHKVILDSEYDDSYLLKAKQRLAELEAEH